MAGFAKNGRMKNIISEHSFADTLVTYIEGCKLLEEVCVEQPVLFAPNSERFAESTQAVIDGVDTSAFRFKN